MFLNIFNCNQEFTHKNDLEKGRSFTLKERLAMKVIGTPKLFFNKT
ncbi:MAG: hypothetical protein WBM53_09615 [Maribacter sp.]